MLELRDTTAAALKAIGRCCADAVAAGSRVLIRAEDIRSSNATACLLAAASEFTLISPLDPPDPQQLRASFIAAAEAAADQIFPETARSKRYRRSK